MSSKDCGLTPVRQSIPTQSVNPRMRAERLDDHLLAEGKDVAAACRELQASEPTCRPAKPPTGSAAAVRQECVDADSLRHWMPQAEIDVWGRRSASTAWF